MYAFLKKQWFGLLGILIGISFSIYSHVSSQIEREPVFITDTTQTLVARGDKKGSEKIKVMDENSKLIDGDVIAIKFHFWNQGRHTIKSEDILETLLLKLEGEDVVIRDLSIVASTRDNVVGASIQEVDNTTLSFAFKTLEKGDGFSGQIIYSANGVAKINLSGDLDGVSGDGILNTKDLERSIFWRWYIPITVAFILAIIAFFAIVALFTKMTMFIGSRLNDSHKSKLQSLSKPIGAVAGCFVFFGYMAIVTMAMANGKALNEMPEKLKTALVDASKKSSSP